jgi:transcriptional regulator with XRE-family HTH domain
MIDPTPDQVRAARGLLDLSQQQLATAAGVSRRSVQMYELGTGGARTGRKVRDALEAAGVVFLQAGEPSPDGGPGVRLSRPVAAPSGRP